MEIRIFRILLRARIPAESRLRARLRNTFQRSDLRGVRLPRAGEQDEDIRQRREFQGTVFTVGDVNIIFCHKCFPDAALFVDNRYFCTKKELRDEHICCDTFVERGRVAAGT